MTCSSALAIIPARGGSKGLPRKNLRDLCGIPLIAYSIITAIKSKDFDRIVVSTEDPEIAEVAKTYGAEVPVLRPKALAQDRSSLVDTVSHMLNVLGQQGYQPDIAVTFFPTHPFRTIGLVNFLVGKVRSGFSHVFTVKAINRSTRSYFRRNQEGALVPLAKMVAWHQSASRSSFSRTYGSFIGDDMKTRTNRSYFHTIRNPIGLIDIDTIEDFTLAENVINRGLFDFNSNDCLDSNNPRIL